MEQYETIYGTLNGIASYSVYQNKILEMAVLTTENKIETRYGVLIPRFRDDDGRRKKGKSISFYKSGKLKSIDLNDQTLIATPLGNIPAELVTFYEDGRLKRVFPSNGELSGYWSEEDEASLHAPVVLTLGSTTYHIQVDCLLFYQRQELQSVKLCHGETIQLPTPIGWVDARNCFSFYENGNIHTLEPLRPTMVHTELGDLEAYDATALGISSDHGSLQFHSDGTLSQMTCSTNLITITLKDKNFLRFKPTYELDSLTLETMVVIPYTIAFSGDSYLFTFNHKEQLHINKKDIASITIKRLSLLESCNDHNCSQCHRCNKL